MTRRPYRTNKERKTRRLENEERAFSEHIRFQSLLNKLRIQPLGENNTTLSDKASEPNQTDSGAGAVGSIRTHYMPYRIISLQGAELEAGQKQIQDTYEHKASVGSVSVVRIELPPGDCLDIRILPDSLFYRDSGEAGVDTLVGIPRLGSSDMDVYRADITNKTEVRIIGPAIALRLLAVGRDCLGEWVEIGIFVHGSDQKCLEGSASSPQGLKQE